MIKQRFFQGVLTLLLLVSSVTNAAAIGEGGFSSMVLKYPVADKSMSGDDIDEAIRSKSVEVGINHHWCPNV